MQKLMFAVALAVAVLCTGLRSPAYAAEWPTVQDGSNGLAVQSAQYLLGAQGHATDADGLFGPRTQARVEAFQEASGLDANGVVDAVTWEKLVIETSSGSTGDAVRATQVALNRHGHGLVVDGIFGARTEAAAKAFQEAYGLDPSGVVDAATWQQLLGSGGASYVLPLPRYLLPRSEYDDPHHDYPAIDLQVVTGTDVFAVQGGTARRVDDASCGIGVVITGNDGARHVYCHFSSWTVGNQDVEAGRKIGESGNTGNSTGPHLHFGVTYGGSNRCPQPLLLAIFDGTSIPAPASLPTSGCSY